MADGQAGVSVLSHVELEPDQGNVPNHHRPMEELTVMDVIQVLVMTELVVHREPAKTRRTDCLFVRYQTAMIGKNIVRKHAASPHGMDRVNCYANMNIL